jgi:hypothetical protein
MIRLRAIPTAIQVLIDEIDQHHRVYRIDQIQPTLIAAGDVRAAPRPTTVRVGQLIFIHVIDEKNSIYRVYPTVTIYITAAESSVSNTQRADLDASRLTDSDISLSFPGFGVCTGSVHGSLVVVERYMRWSE